MMPQKLKLYPLLTPLMGVLLVTGFAHLVFGKFFPGPNGMGHDHSGLMPALLADYYWTRSSGIFTPPWFSPAFCGGVPYFADPGSGFYSFPSLLVRIFEINPLASVYVTFLGFVAIGFLGAYLFSRHSLALSVIAALVAGVFFSLNGFYTHRFIIGHTGFHGVMLAPWLAYFVVSSSRQVQRQFSTEILKVIGGALVLAYWVQSGAQSLIVALGLSAAALILMAWYRNPDMKPAIQRSLGIIVLGLAISASKIVAALSFLAQFPRSDYRLPGFSSLMDSVWVLFLTLFQNRIDISAIAASKMQNLQWFQDRHELENGQTWVPIALLILVICSRLLRPSPSTTPPRRSWASWASLCGLVLVLATPLAINTYSPSWNEFLKTLPILGSSSSLVRWFVVYVPIVAITSGLLVDSAPWGDRARQLVGVVSVGVFLVATMNVDRGYYLAQSYDPKTIVDAFDAAERNPTFRPSITAIGAMTDESGQIIMTGNRNDLVAYGASQLACYVPIFGYALEHFPVKSLHPGPALNESAGVLNVKNPACYVFPRENFCVPGDHFSLSRKEDAIKFLNYKPFEFEKSGKQKIADVVTLLGLALAVIGLAWAGLVTLFRRNGIRA
jgi:hypothetical protein